MTSAAILPGRVPSRPMIGALLLSLALHAGAGAIVSGIWSRTTASGDPVALDAIDAELLEAGAVGTGAVVGAPEPAGRPSAPAATGDERAEAVDPPPVVPTLDVAPEAVAAIAPPLTAPAETAAVDRSAPPPRVDEVMPSEPDPTLVTSPAADMPPPEREAPAPEARPAEPVPIAPSLAAPSPDTPSPAAPSFTASTDAMVVPPGPATPPAPARAAVADALTEATDPAILTPPLAAAMRPPPEPKPAAETKPAPEPAREPKPAAPPRARPEPTRPRSIAAAPPLDRSTTRPKADGGPTGAPAPRPPAPARAATAAGGGAPAAGGGETARPAARAAGSGEASDAIARYMAAVRARIVSRQRPGDGTPGTVVVSFEVRRDGGLEQVAAISGGTGDLQSAAIRIVRAAAPAPPFPEAIGAARLRMTVALRFE
ncbi:TonB family protein [Prosthecomicrobium hirschii]|uniref:TonB family protein n=1 Tax=Prosthecodimorpha hirschii TaxID=665126 RepID=UPI0022201A56|nr:TonB family protein [Prosthecomicrobium hirschii]MCW1839666.1 TonB family protein [Prosthecomicrobium hirschii]